jgi:hypothetical protein
VSDFLGRIAARAVGEAPLAQPRLPELFEQPGGADDAGIQEIDEEIVVERAPAPVPVDAPTRTVGEQVHAPERAPQPSPTAQPKQPEAAPSPRRARATTASQPRRTERVVVEPVVPLPASPGTAAEASAPDAVVPVAAAVAAPAAVARRVAAPFEAPAPAVPSPARDEAPAVRVHIGRLEVRANLQQAPPQPRTREEAPPQGPSLSDYLRGKRVAG